ncbi:MAG: LD-carboxypeptidase [Fimbriimonadaceae bacterium]|nr:LD-carboxypeptidase [Fimbriimonadaceae bacterium]QYK56068.1 MAG: LD-carboxypeptidase [Fimbriimonadaceae bacterium]
MTKLPRLEPGAHIRVVSPASSIEPAKIEKGVAVLEAEGYRVTLGANVFERDGYLAGTDGARAADLQDAFADPGVDCVFCSRGGYGCARLLPLLDLDRMAASGKLLVGFSDVTALHTALNRRGLPTLYGPMLLTLGSDRAPWVTQSLLRAMRGEDSIVTEAPAGKTLVPGRAQGVVTGGCVCLIASSLATPEAIETEGKILLLEDVDEPAHRVDSMLTQLRNGGFLQRAAGIVVGEMTGTDDQPKDGIGHWDWRRIVQDRVGDLGVPAVFDFPFGHAMHILTLPLGVPATLDAEKGTLLYA